MTTNIFERDLAIVNAILSQHEITLQDRMQLLHALGISYHKDGKIEGAYSIDASAHGCEFCAMMR